MSSMVGSWLGHLGTLIAVLVILWSCLKTVQLKTPTGNLQILLQLVTFYARYWFVWLLVWANIQLLYDNQTIYWLLIALSLLYLYMSWVEPNRLRVSRFPIYLTIPATYQPDPNVTLDVASPQSTKPESSKPPSAKIAVLSDIHLGIFTNKHQLARLVKCINSLEVDAVFILGDWLYHASAELIEQMTALTALHQPCYTVWSEADNQQLTKPQPNSEDPTNQQVMTVLASLGIQVLPEQGLTIAGMKIIGVHDGSTMDLPRVIEQQSRAGHPLVIATHDIKQLEANPRILSDAKDNSLIIAGQTHGGQVNIPVLTTLLVRALTGNKLAAGLRKPNTAKRSDQANKQLNDANKPSKRYQVWVNTGIGMTGLPFRFNCPPTIDVLTIAIKTANQ